MKPNYIMLMHLILSASLFSMPIAHAQTQKIEVYPNIGHSESINEIKFQNDGLKFISYAVAAGEQYQAVESSVKLWNTKTGRLLRKFIPGNEGINAVAISPTGAIIAAITKSNIHIWKADSGEKVNTSKLPTESQIEYGNGKNSQLVFSSNERQIGLVLYRLDDPDPADKNRCDWTCAYVIDIYSGRIIIKKPIDIQPSSMLEDGDQIVARGLDDKEKYAVRRISFFPKILVEPQDRSELSFQSRTGALLATTQISDSGQTVSFISKNKKFPPIYIQHDRASRDIKNINVPSPQIAASGEFAIYATLNAQIAVVEKGQKSLRTLKPNLSDYRMVSSLSISPNSKYIGVTAGANIRIIEVATGNLNFSIDAYERSLTSYSDEYLEKQNAIAYFEEKEAPSQLEAPRQFKCQLNILSLLLNSSDHKTFPLGEKYCRHNGSNLYFADEFFIFKENEFKFRILNLLDGREDLFETKVDDEVFGLLIVGFDKKLAACTDNGVRIFENIANKKVIIRIASSIGVPKNCGVSKSGQYIYQWNQTKIQLHDVVGGVSSLIDLSKSAKAKETSISTHDHPLVSIGGKMIAIPISRKDKNGIDGDLVAIYSAAGRLQGELEIDWLHSSFLWLTDEVFLISSTNNLTKYKLSTTGISRVSTADSEEGFSTAIFKKLNSDELVRINHYFQRAQILRGNSLIPDVDIYYGASNSFSAHLNSGYSYFSNKKLDLTLRLNSAVVPFDTFFDVFHRPDIVKAKLRGEDISKLIGDLTIEKALQNPPPSVTLSQPPAQTAAKRIKVAYTLTPDKGGVAEKRIFHNGKLIESDGTYKDAPGKAYAPIGSNSADAARYAQDNITKRQTTASESAGSGANQPGSLRSQLVVRGAPEKRCTAGQPKDPCQGEIEVEVIPGEENTISVVAFNRDNTIQSQAASVSFQSTLPKDAPHLWLLAVGIDQFTGITTLKNARKDAQDFACTYAGKNAVAKLGLPCTEAGQAQSLFKPENIHVVDALFDSKATKGSIQAALAQIAAQAKPSDTFVWFVASHGMMDANSLFGIIAHDTRCTQQDAKRNCTDLEGHITSNDILEASKKIKAMKQLMVLDTCHSGGLDSKMSGLYDARMSLLAKNMGLHMYASAQATETAQDGIPGTNGTFTAQLLAGIKGAAPKNSEGQISVMTLGQYAKQKTIEATQPKSGAKDANGLNAKDTQPAQTPVIQHFGLDAGLVGVGRIGGK